MDTLDRVQFALSVDTGSFDYESVMLRFFDQLMGIYGMIQPCNYTVAIIDTTNENLTLDIKFNDSVTAPKVANILSSSIDKQFIIYQRMFNINRVFPVSSDTIEITMQSI